MKIGKIYPAAAVSLFFAAQAFSMSYLPGQWSTAEKSGKWSTCTWGNNINNDSADMPGKPGPNDDVTIRGGWDFEIDQDIAVGGLHSNCAKLFHASKRNIRTKRGFGTQIPSSNSDPLTKLENCTVQNGGNLNFSYWHEGRGGGRGELRLIDTKFETKGEIVCTIPVNPIVTIKERAGVIVTLVGKTQFLVNGGAVLDSIFEESPKDWMFKWNVEEKDGAVPLAFINKKAAFKNHLVEMEIDGNLKPGKYALFEFADRKSGFSDAVFTLNGSDYKLGTATEVKGKKIKISLAPSPTGKDAKSANDLVLEVMK